MQTQADMERFKRDILNYNGVTPERRNELLEYMVSNRLNGDLNKNQLNFLLGNLEMYNTPDISPEWKWLTRTDLGNYVRTAAQAQAGQAQAAQAQAAQAAQAEERRAAQAQAAQAAQAAEAAAQKRAAAARKLKASEAALKASEAAQKPKAVQKPKASEAPQQT